jgi:hypothetical protein
MRLFDLKHKKSRSYDEDLSAVFDNLTAFNAQYQPTWRVTSINAFGLTFNAA